MLHKVLACLGNCNTQIHVLRVSKGKIVISLGQRCVSIGNRVEEENKYFSCSWRLLSIFHVLYILVSLKYSAEDFLQTYVTLSFAFLSFVFLLCLCLSPSLGSRVIKKPLSRLGVQS